MAVKKTGLSLNVQIKEVQVEIAKHRDKQDTHNQELAALRDKLASLNAQKGRGRR